jgi:hypothetical protein
MPYAANGQISTEPFSDAIEITQEQYAEAVNGMCAGLEVTIDNGFKVAPPLVPEPEPAPEPTLGELTAIANDRRDYLLTLAAFRIAPLQDAIDLDSATDVDKANLKLWKQYRVDVNRVPDQAGFPTTIDWPVQPS